MEPDHGKLRVGCRVELRILDDWFRGTIVAAEPNSIPSLPTLIYKTTVELDELAKAVESAYQPPKQIIWLMGPSLTDSRLVSTLDLLAEIS
jgi:hypothetical protein